MKRRTLPKLAAIALPLALLSTAPNARAQCSLPTGWVGCASTDYSNAYLNSNNNPATIEYDNLISSFHTTVVRESDGSFRIWGEKAANDTTSLNAPQVINSTNYPVLAGTVLKVALGSSMINKFRGVVLTTTGLYTWGTLDGSDNLLIPSAVRSTNSALMEPIADNLTDGNTFGLPTGVTPADVKMLFGTKHFLAITTCDGQAWVLSARSDVRGNGSTGNNTSWARVTKDTDQQPLDNVIAVRGSSGTAITLSSGGR